MNEENNQRVEENVVSEVKEEKTDNLDVSIPEKSSNSKSGILLIISFVLIIIVIFLLLYKFVVSDNKDKLNGDTGNSIELIVDDPEKVVELSGYSLKLKNNFVVSDEDGKSVVLTDYESRYQVSIEIDPGCSSEVYLSHLDTLKDEFSRVYNLSNVSYENVAVGDREWYMFNAQDSGDISYTYSLSNFSDGTVKVLTISASNDFMSIYDGLSSMLMTPKTFDASSNNGEIESLEPVSGSDIQNVEPNSDSGVVEDIDLTIPKINVIEFEEKKEDE